MPESLSADEIARLSTEQMWRDDAASRMLGMQILSVGPGTAELSMRVRDDMINGWGLCHGGLIASLADSAFAVACNSRGTVTVAAGFDVQFLRSAQLGDDLRARAHEVDVVGRTGVYDVTVTRAGDDASIARFRGRSHSLGRPNSAVPAG